MYPVTITIQNDTQLNAVLQALRVAPFDPATERAFPQSGSDSRTVAEVDQAIKAENAPEKASKAPKETKAQAAPAPETAVTYQQAADAVTQLAQAKGRDAAVAVLALFGAKKLPEVHPEDFASVIAACAQALQEEVAA